MQRTIAMLVVAVSMTAAAHAQTPATTFAELSNRLSVGETVFVTSQAGRAIKGTVQQMSDTVLVVKSGPDELTLTASDVLRVARRGHSLRNGALIGLATGFVVGGTLAAVADDCTYTCFSSPSGVLAFGALFGAVGVGVGAAVGASLRKEHVVFERAATRPLAAVTPLLPRGGAGLRVLISW